MYDIKKFGELYLEPSKNGLSRSSIINGNGVKIVNMGELFGYPRMRNPEMRRVTTNTKENKAFGVSEGDLLFARRSLVAEGAGKCNIILEVESPTVFESSIIRVRLNKKISNPLFYYYYFSSSIGFGAIQTIVNEVAASGIRSSELAKLKVLYPKVDVQNRIAAYVNNYDELIEINNQRIKLLEETAHELYKEWFVRMRFPEYKKAKFVKGIPEAWEVKPILSLCSRITDGTHDTPKPLEEGIPLITGKHLIDGRIDFESAYKISLEDHEKIKKRSGLVKGDILFSNIGTIGSTAVVYEEFEYSVKNVIIFKPALSQYSLFLYYMILSEGVREQMLMDAFGTSQQFISLGYIRKLKTIIPTKNLIFRFSEIVVPMFEQIQNLQQQNTHLRQIRDRLLPRLISGKLQVNFDKILLNSKTEN